MMIAHLLESGCKGTTKFHICKHHVRIFSKECANSSLGKGRKGRAGTQRQGTKKWVSACCFLVPCLVWMRVEEPLPAAVEVELKGKIIPVAFEDAVAYIIVIDAPLTLVSKIKV